MRNVHDHCHEPLVHAERCRSRPAPGWAASCISGWLAPSQRYLCVARLDGEPLQKMPMVARAWRQNETSVLPADADRLHYGRVSQVDSNVR